MRRRLIVVMLGMLGVAGCTATQEIETAPPQPRTGAPGDTVAAAREAPLTVVLVQGETPFDENVSRLRFRVTEIRLRRSDGRWIRLPSDSGPVELVNGGEGARRTLLDGLVAPVTYDSMTIALDDIFVRFGLNAGAPLTTGKAPQRLSLILEPELGFRTTVVLRMEPAASLVRSPDCEWLFVPVLRPVVSTRPIAPVESTPR